VESTLGSANQNAGVVSSRELLNGANLQRRMVSERNEIPTFLHGR